jgi:transcriptional regulator with XRE-family HTH domain
MPTMRGERAFSLGVLLATATTLSERLNNSQPVFCKFCYTPRMPVSLIKKSKLPAEEVDICQRIRQIRETVRLNQPSFAQAIGTNRANLSNLEYALAPLRFGLAQQICTKFDINQRWLATGDGPMHPCLDIQIKFPPQISSKSLFSLVYFSFLQSHVEQWWEVVAKQFPDSPTLGRRRQIWPEDAFPSLLASIQGNLRNAQNLMRQARANESERAALLDESNLLVAAALESAGAMERSLSPEVKGFFKQHKKGDRISASECKDIIDTKKPGVIVAVMSAKDVPTWPQLKKTITKLTSGHGQKAALADELGVSRQVLGNWLSDGEQGAPNAELTLRLFKWSLDPKRQQPK